MARLHDIDGVTRVSLSKSTPRRSKPAATATASEVDAAQRAGRAASGKRPEFEVVMFFEKAAETVANAPSATGGASATPTPTPTPTRARPRATTTATTTRAQGGATP